MKKLLSLLLCLLLMTTMLTACGNIPIQNTNEDKNNNDRPHSSIEDNAAAVTIGANGNLEIALKDENVSWDNQIVLLNRLYGLNQVIPYPARLSTNGNAIQCTAPLQIPVYGADGRVSEWKPSLVGTYDKNEHGFICSQSTSVSVGAIGISTDMSPREAAISNDKSALITYQNTAANTAKDAIRMYGGQLAAITLKYQNDDGTGIVDEADVAVLTDLIATLETSVSNISESMKSAVLVVVAADKSLSDDEWAMAAGLAEGKDIVKYIAALQTDYSSVALPTELTDIIAKYEAIGNKLTAAETALPASGDGTWGDIKDVVDSLLTVSDIRIGGYTIFEIENAYKNEGMGSDVAKDLFNKVSDGSLTYSFTGGIFATIADLTGDYTSSMAFPTGTTVEGLDLNMLGSKPVNIEGENGAIGSLGALVNTAVIANSHAPKHDINGSILLTDTYGYVINLLFRTNATETDLLLQTEPTNRYAEGAVDLPVGAGSRATFAISDDYTTETIENVVKGLRLVFCDNSGNIVGIAALDVNNGVVENNNYTMYWYLHDYSINQNNEITLGAVKSENTFCALSANTDTALSALLYLDGAVVSAADTALTDKMDMALYLQFVNSAQ